jgi:hypothetical protein
MAAWPGWKATLTIAPPFATVLIAAVPQNRRQRALD